MFKFLRYTLVVLLFIALAAIRFFDQDIFGSELSVFFATEFSYAEPPVFDVFHELTQITLRFLLNSVISLAIIFLLFRSKRTLKFAALLYAINYIVLAPVLVYFLTNLTQGEYFYLFYTRRFLVQPVLIIILIPAFYYQKMMSQQKE
ncbi:exosortase F system-associated membrane protein [Psychroflexus halocasei]|uniref:Exosortase F-associated protein n=1 Tax=Psychroflexus halocasei TaxID=908615 RepID=A0A1H3W3R0_9FLAO|nr:exosortase F system-associated protein [Psychroflexus halocasei]SDZ81064.1 exosortase F-associated protein [Psychroflexus halocasei]